MNEKTKTNNSNLVLVNIMCLIFKIYYNVKKQEMNFTATLIYNVLEYLENTPLQQVNFGKLRNKKSTKKYNIQRKEEVS
jgi:hypothetical protein